MCVSVSESKLKIEAVRLSHTVGPTSCFHCPSLLPKGKARGREQRLSGPPEAAIVYLLMYSKILPQSPRNVRNE